MTSPSPAIDERKILHVDMDAFYASIEQRDNPDLQGKPVVVGGGENRGVVAAASYEARQFGIYSAMPMREASRRCPHLERVAPRMSVYKEVSDQVFAIFRNFTPLVEGLSLDEAFLDVSGSIALFGSDVEIARRIKKSILSETGLTASVGVAPNKLVAKIASDLDKPDGLKIVTAGNLRETLDPLPVRVIPGIGRETLRRLEKFRIATIADLRTAPDANLDAVFGRFAARTRERAAGIDDRQVVSSRAEKSISAETTFDRDLADTTEIHSNLLRLTERTTSRLRAKSLWAGTVQIKIRQSDFSTFTRQRALHPPANSTDQLYLVAKELLSIWRRENPGARIRLLGVGGSDLLTDMQGDLFETADNGPGSELDQAVDRIRDRFGSLSLGRARTLKPDQIR